MVKEGGGLSFSLCCVRISVAVAERGDAQRFYPWTISGGRICEFLNITALDNFILFLGILPLSKFILFLHFIILEKLFFISSNSLILSIRAARNTNIWGCAKVFMAEAVVEVVGGSVFVVPSCEVVIFPSGGRAQVVWSCWSRDCNIFSVWSILTG